MAQNIVLVVMDAARPDRLPFYGYDRDTAPFLSRLAEESAVYRNAYSQATWTLPAHVSLFTGEYAKDHGAVSEDYRVDGFDLFDTLEEEGYTTIGSSANGYISDEYGFGELFDRFQWLKRDQLFPGASDAVWEEVEDAAQRGEYGSRLRKYLGFGMRCLRRAEFRQLANGFYQLLNKAFWRGDQGARCSTAFAIDAVEQVDEPFFLFINYMEPHGPYKPPWPYARQFLPDDVSRREAARATRFDPNAVMAGEASLDDREQRIVEGLYEAALRYLDSRIEELYTALDSAGVLDDTVFIVTADHGEAFGEDGVYSHTTGITPGVVRVPLLVRSPGAAASVNSEVVELRQLKEFMAGLARGDDATLQPQEYAFTEWYRGVWDDTYGAGDLDGTRHVAYNVSVQDGDRMLVRTASGDELFWDLGTLEQLPDDAAGREEMRDLLEQRFGDVFQDPEDRIPSADREMSDELRRRLEELGY